MAGTRTGTVVRAMPWLGRGWAVTAGRVSGVLLDLMGTPLAASPPTLHPVLRPALRAWGRLHCVLRTAQHRTTDALCLVVVHPDDVAAFGELVRELGRGLLPGADPRLVAALERAAERTGCDPQRLVVELARMHGVLDLELGRDGERLLAVSGLRAVGGPDAAARDRVAARVCGMWRAGDPDGTGAR